MDVQTAPPAGLIDVHTHAVNPELPDLSTRHPGDHWPTYESTSESQGWLMFGGTQYRHIDHRCWSAAVRIADMNRTGVALQVVSPIPVTFCYQADPNGTAELCAAQNDFFATLVHDHPGRFAALGAVPLQNPDLAVDELRRCMRRPGFLGVEIGTQIAGTELGDESLDRFFAVAHELDAMVLVHPSDQDLLQRVSAAGLGFGAGMPSETGIAAAMLLTGGALARRPSVRMCFAHGGGTLPAMIGRLDKGTQIAGTAPDPTQLPSRLARQLCCDSITYNASALLAAIATFGAEHVLLGSDYPFPAMPTPIDGVVTDLSPDLRDRICRTNLEELHGALLGSGHDSLPIAGGH